MNAWFFISPKAYLAAFSSMLGYCSMFSYEEKAPYIADSSNPLSRNPS
jgi:hypothetical protein